MRKYFNKLIIIMFIYFVSVYCQNTNISEMEKLDKEIKQMLQKAYDSIVPLNFTDN